MGFPPENEEALSQRASLLRDSLRRSQSTANQMVAKISSLDRRLSSLGDSIHPVTVMASSMAKAHENIGKTLGFADAILTRFDILRQAEAIILRGTINDWEEILAAINMLRRNMHFFHSGRGLNDMDIMGKHFNNLLAKAIRKLEEEFRLGLSSYSQILDPEDLPNYLSESSGSTSEMLDSSQSSATCDDHEVEDFENLIRVPPKDLLLLHELAQELVIAGHEVQCSRIYRDIRGLALEQTLQKLGVERLQTDLAQIKQWNILEARIKNWNCVFRIAVKCLFRCEKKICNEIFKDLDPLRERCFAGVISSSVQILFSYVEAVLESGITLEKLFTLLDMYKTMQDLHPDMQTLFEGKACLAMLNSASNLKKNLSQAIYETLTYFKERIAEDPAKASPDGRVHPMTSYVINHLRFQFDYLPILQQSFQELSSWGNSSYQLETMLTHLLHSLELNLNAKAKQYKDSALACLFLANNIHYIVAFIRGSKANNILSKDWVDRRRRTVQQNASQYKRVAWAQVVGTLSSQGLGSSGSGGNYSSSALKEEVRERFKSFNMQFEEVHQRQSRWFVRDQDLADNLRLSVSEIVLPAYRSFLKKTGPLLDNTRNKEKFVKYSPETIEHMIGDLFQGGDR